MRTDTKKREIWKWSRLINVETSPKRNLVHVRCNSNKKKNAGFVFSV